MGWRPPGQGSPRHTREATTQKRSLTVVKGAVMAADKAQVVEILRGRGDHELADRVNRELPATFDPSEVELLRGLDLGVDTGDAQRHAGAGQHEDMTRLPEGGSSTADD